MISEVQPAMNTPRKKVFVIGRNKTGTTSMMMALKSLGYRVGDQARAELLLEDWARRDFRKIVAYCESADAFQDVPFSLDYTYEVLDYAFPGSKFILTVRDDAAQWYDSLLQFHTEMIGRNRVPTADDIKQFRYRKPGYLWRAAQLIYGVDENSLYDRKIYTEHYDRHNRQVREYFRFRPDDLLVLNLADSGAMKALGDFLGADSTDRVMPRLNVSGKRSIAAAPAAAVNPRAPIMAATLVDRARQADPRALLAIPDEAAESLVRNVFGHMKSTLAAASQGVVRYAGLGVFRVREARQGAKGKEGPRTLIVFRPAGPQPGRRG
jgi:hypothetical protein